MQVAFWITLIVGTLAFDDGICVKNRTVYDQQGDAVLLVFVDLNYGPFCNITSPKGFQELTTTIYIMSTFIKNNYIPGITLGLRVIDTCQDSAEVFKQSLALSTDLDCDVDQTYSLGILAPGFYAPVLQPFKDYTDIPIMLYYPQYITQTLVTIAVSFISTRFKSIDLLLTDSKTTFEMFGNESAKAGVCIKSLVDLEGRDNSGESLVVIAGDEFYVRSWMLREEVKSIRKTWIIIPLDNSDIQDVIPQGSFVLSTETIIPEVFESESWEGSNLENTKIHLPYLFSIGKPLISIIDLFANFQNANCSYQDSCSSSNYDYRLLKEIPNSRIFDALGNLRTSNTMRVSILERSNPEVMLLEEIAAYEVDINTFEIFAQEHNPALNNCNIDVCDDCINFKSVKTQKPIDLDVDKKEKITVGIHLIKRAWVYIILSLVVCGTLACISVTAYIAYRFFTEEFLDGNPTLTFLLITGTIFVLHSVIPFCLNGGDYAEYLNSRKIFVSTLSIGIVFSVMLARSFFLAFSTKGVFSSHINGFLESLMVFFVGAVQLSMSLMFFFVNSASSQEILRSMGFIALMSYDILLLLMLLGISSLIKKIPRNYCEGSCFFYTAIGLLIDWTIWLGIFLLVNPEWREIIIAIGLLTTAYIIISGIFLTRVYYMVTYLERRKDVRNHFESADLRSEPRRRSFRTARRPFQDYVLPMEGVRNPSVGFPTARPNFYGSSSPQRHQQMDKVVGFNNYGYHSDIHETENHYVVPSVCIDSTDTHKRRAKNSDYAQPTYPIRAEEDYDSECIETEMYVEGSRLSPYKKGPNESYPSRCTSPKLHPTEATINEEDEEVEEMTKITRF